MNFIFQIAFVEGCTRSFVNNYNKTNDKAYNKKFHAFAFTARLTRTCFQFQLKITSPILLLDIFLG